MKKISFNEKVYAIVRLIPKGQVTSYGRIAEMLDSPRGARQVGFAMSALKGKVDDPKYSDVPWQRVINSQGKISIKGSDGGRIMQTELLREEGVMVQKVGNDLKIKIQEYLWEGLLPHEVDQIFKSY